LLAKVNSGVQPLLKDTIRVYRQLNFGMDQIRDVVRQVQGEFPQAIEAAS
jgi:hypothetical protein